LNCHTTRGHAKGLQKHLINAFKTLLDIKIIDYIGKEHQWFSYFFFKIKFSGYNKKLEKKQSFSKTIASLRSPSLKKKIHPSVKVLENKI